MSYIQIFCSVPSSLNYIHLNGSQDQPLNPYPSWDEAFVAHRANNVSINSTVVSAFRIAVDRFDRLWVVDNGIMDMYGETRQIAKPAILIFDLKTDTLIHRYDFQEDIFRDTSQLTSIVVDIPGKGKECSYAYIADTGSNAIIAYSLQDNIAWRLENNFFHFDPHAGLYVVGGIEFYWSHGVSGLALGQRQPDGNRDLYFHPTSSTKLFKINTKHLRSPDVPQRDIFIAIEIVGERGPRTQSIACDFDPYTNVLFYTQVDLESNVWMLSNRQSRFLYDKMNFNQVNFRILTAPIKLFVQNSTCEKLSVLDRAFTYIMPKVVQISSYLNGN